MLCKELGPAAIGDNMQMTDQEMPDKQYGLLKSYKQTLAIARYGMQSFG
jgi:hypothetical protein